MHKPFNINFEEGKDPSGKYVQQTIESFPSGLISWYDFSSAQKILFIGENTSYIGSFLKTKCDILVWANIDDFLQEDKFAEKVKGIVFDYIIAIRVLEQSKNPVDTLKTWKSLLSPTGKMLIGAENRLGLKYFCGEKDPFTKRSFDGLTNYKYALDLVSSKNAKSYSMAELKNFFTKADIKNNFYSSPYGLDFAQVLYREDHLPLEELSSRILIKYNSPDTIFLDEEAMYSDIIENGMFHSMANGYLIEASLNGEFSDVLHVTSSVERGRKKALATIIKEDKVIKKALYDEAIERIHVLDENTKELQAKGVNMIEGELSGDSYIMPFFDGENMVTRLKRLFYEDRDEMIKEMDELHEIIKNSSEQVSTDPEVGVKLHKCFIDLTIVNCFYKDGKYYFFDQEAYVKNVAANAITYRSIISLYMADPNIVKAIPKEFFFERYNMMENQHYYHCYNLEYVGGMQNGTGLRNYWLNHLKNYSVLASNRVRASHTIAEYKKIFIDLFKDIESKKVILFGSGQFATHFISIYKDVCDIHCVIDNNQKRWGEELEGVAISSPDILKESLDFDYRVIVCVRNFEDIIEQIKDLDVNDYCVYDKNISYGKIRKMSATALSDTTKKKYNVGYIAGVFDMFHVGHLNLFKRAKEQCKYLIVGVVTDQGVTEKKEAQTVIPFKDRLEIVNSCKYVDQAVEIPFDFETSRDAHNIYNFDCQFSGGDYINDRMWLDNQEYLRSKGADLVFFEYTDGVSSSKLKEIVLGDDEDEVKK